MLLGKGAEVIADREPPPAVVIHVPHASIEVPDEIRRTFVINDRDLAHELLLMTDRFTDELFNLPPAEASVVAAGVSRLVVDVERFPSDKDEPMAPMGMGARRTAPDGEGGPKDNHLKSTQRSEDPGL